MQDRVIVVKPSRGFQYLQLHELWLYRDLIAVLAWRDVSSRYKQTVLGIGWAIFQPMIMMFVMTIIFGNLGKLPSEGKPYPLFAYTGMLPWQYFATASVGSATCLWGANAPLLSKVYFPRLVLPLSATLPALLDLAAAFTALFAMMIYYGVVPQWKVVFLPLYILLALLTTLGLGLWFSAVGVEYRDMRHMLPLFIQTCLYASPVAYSTTMIPQQWQVLYAINPMVSVIEGFRDSLLGTGVLTAEMLLASVTSAGVILVTGAIAFRQLECKFADMV